MNANLYREVGMGLSFLVILLSGFWLSRSGQPYGTMLVTFHKLLSLAAIILFGITVRQMNRTGALSTIEWLVVIVTSLIFFGTLVTGGLLTTDKAMPAIVLKLHHIMPYLTIVFSALSLYLLQSIRG